MQLQPCHSDAASADAHQAAEGQRSCLSMPSSLQASSSSCTRATSCSGCRQPRKCSASSTDAATTAKGHQDRLFT